MLSFRLEGGWRQCQRAGSLQRAPHTCGCYAAKCAKHGQVIAGPQLSAATHTVWQKSATASCANRLAMRNSPRSAILLLRVIRVLHSLRNGDPGNKPTSRCPRCFCSQTAGLERRCPPLPRPGAPHPAPWVRPSQPHPRPASTARGTHGPGLSFRHRPGLPLRGAGRARRGGVPPMCSRCPGFPDSAHLAPHSARLPRLQSPPARAVLGPAQPQHLGGAR